MVTPELIAFVRHSRERGNDDAGVIRTLSNQGWSEADIHEAFVRVRGRLASARKGSLLTTLTTIVMLIAFWPAGLVLMWFATNWPKVLKVLVTVFLLVLTVFSIVLVWYADKIY